MFIHSKMSLGCPRITPWHVTLSLWSFLTEVKTHSSWSSAPSYVGVRVCTGEVLHTESNHLAVGWGRVQEAARKDLATGLAEVLRQEGVEDRIDAGISIRQAVGNDTKGKGGIIEGKWAKLYPHGDNVVRCPADSERSNKQENRLSRLQDNRNINQILNSQEGGVVFKIKIKKLEN